MELEKVLKSVWKKIPEQCKYAFCGAFVIGLLDYLYTITNKFLTLDSMWNIYSAQDMITSGRQFLTYACRISSYFDLPAVNGILAILYLALAAALIVHIFEIRSLVLSVLAGGMLVTFPAISSTFCYTYTVDGYMLALLLVVIAYEVTEHWQFGWIPAALFTGFSLGVYQAYYSFLIILCVLKLLAWLLYEKDWREVVKKAFRYILAGVLGYAFYGITLKLMLARANLTLSGYQGTDRVFGFALRELPINCYKATRNFFSFVFSMNVLTGTPAMRVALFLLALTAAAAFLYLFVANRVYKSPVRCALILLLLAATPMLATLAMVMAPDCYFHVLMRAPWALFFVFALYLTEKACGQLGTSGVRRQINLIWALVTVLFTAVMIWQFFVMQGIVAFNMNERYEKTYSLCSRIVARLEQEPEYCLGEPVAIIGGYPDPDRYPPTSITGNTVGWYFGVNGEYCATSTRDIREFCAHYLGVYFVAADDETTNALLQTEEFAKMGHFPEEDCLRNIDGVWVFKLNGEKNDEKE